MIPIRVRRPHLSLKNCGRKSANASDRLTGAAVIYNCLLASVLEQPLLLSSKCDCCCLSLVAFFNDWTVLTSELVASSGHEYDIKTWAVGPRASKVAESALEK